jgi:hypothetical protein
VASDIVDVRTCTINGGGELALLASPLSQVTLDSRAVRPYPPGNVKFNAELFPVILEDPITATWESRNRLQQTSGILLDWYAASVTPEVGTTYTVTIHRDNITQDVIQTISGITALTQAIAGLGETGFFLARVSTQRDGYDSFQLLENRFWYSTLNDTSRPRDFKAQQENGGLTTLSLFNPTLGEDGDLQVAVILHRGTGVALATPAGWTFVSTGSEEGTEDNKISIYTRVVSGAPLSPTEETDFTSTDSDVKDGYMFTLENATGIGSAVETTLNGGAFGSISSAEITWTASTLYIYDFDVLSASEMTINSVDTEAKPIEFELGDTTGTGALRMYAAYNHFDQSSLIELSNVCDYVRITAIEILT